MINNAIQRFYKEISDMGLTEGDKAICAQIAERIIKDVMQEHIKSCPHNIRWKLAAALVIGAFLGNAGIGIALAKFLM
jgi:hypothetical protein